MGDGASSSARGGFEVGKANKGKDIQRMLMAEGDGIPVCVLSASAKDADLKGIENLVDVRVKIKRRKRLLFDTAADADCLRHEVARHGIEQMTPHCGGRYKPCRLDGRAIRRYITSWKIRSTIRWPQYERRLLVRHESRAHPSKAACISPA